MTPHFSRSELECHCGCGAAEMDEDFLDKLELLREAYAKPMAISSGYRCPKHNATVSKTGASGPHTTGMAVDVLVSGSDAYDLVRIALAQGFTGIGVAQRGPHQSRFIHIDTIEAPTRPWVWSY